MRKLFKSLGFKLFMCMVSLAALVGTSVGITVALFTASNTATGVFTIGNAYIELTESAVKEDIAGNLLPDPDSPRIQGADTTEGGTPVIHNYGNIFPGQKIYKDPTVRNTGSSDAWIGVKVVFEDGAGDIHKLFKYNDYWDDIDIETMLSGGLLDEMVHVDDWMGNEFVCFNENYAMIQVSNHATGIYEFYFLMLKPLAPNETVTVFDTFSVHPQLDASQMQEFVDLKITIQAFGTHASGFESCYDAMVEAFPAHFKDINKQ